MWHSMRVVCGGGWQAMVTVGDMLYWGARGMPRCVRSKQPLQQPARQTSDGFGGG